MTTQRYLLDELETADMLEIDGLHAWRFELNENLLDQADLAAEADQPFASEDWVLAVESLDGRTRREWRFSYNAVMEAEPQADGESWRLTTGRGRTSSVAWERSAPAARMSEATQLKDPMKKGAAWLLFPFRAGQAALASAWVTARFSALNRARKLAVVMFSSMPMPCSGRWPSRRISI